MKITRLLGLAPSLLLLATACSGAPDEEPAESASEALRRRHHDAGTAPAPPPTSTSPAPGAGVPVTPQFFGMHIEQQFALGWPTVPFGIQRTWNAWPAVFWESISSGDGKYDWTSLDALVADALSHNVELLYTIGHVPVWASSNPGGKCNDSATGTCYVPKNMASWTNFVSAITSRYKGKIKYWELWNEPDASWGGPVSDLAAMAKAAYPIIKANGGLTVSPSPQGTNGPAWMQRYLDAGGTPYADINGFHAYLYGAPETLTSLVTSYRTLFSNYGIGNRPLFDTEHSWGEPSDPFGSNTDQQSAWLARFQILSVNNRIDRSIWYGWEFDNWGTLWSKSTKKILPTGVAYQNVHDWLVDGTLAPCQTSGNVYTCHILRSGYDGIAAWTTGSGDKLTVPDGYTHYRTIDGGTTAVSAGQSVTLTMKPFLFEK